MAKARIYLVSCLLLVFIPSACYAFSDSEVLALQKKAHSLSRPDRIAFFARKFIGTPYDKDPLGAYVRNAEIVHDSAVDCMYHVFRSTELAFSNTPQGARREALYLRFKHMGRVDKAGKVLNYDDRFQYGEDMILSGKWGRDVTASLGKTEKMEGSRGIPFVNILPKSLITGALPRFKDGDIVFFVKHPKQRVVGEIIGHMGIIAVQDGTVYLVHAHGTKARGGMVAKVPFGLYAKGMPFAGVMVTRFY
ncbi:MAG: hypothetical protein M0Z52_10935 [Actinomycetota bacterium]|nr:hypothetical protein [Actinomycetota bacterium]